MDNEESWCIPALSPLILLAVLVGEVNECVPVATVFDRLVTIILMVRTIGLMRVGAVSRPGTSAVASSVERPGGQNRRDWASRRLQVIEIASPSFKAATLENHAGLQSPTSLLKYSRLRSALADAAPAVVGSMSCSNIAQP